MCAMFPFVIRFGVADCSMLLTNHIELAAQTSADADFVVQQ